MSDEVTKESLLARVEAALKRDEQWIMDNIHAMISAIENHDEQPDTESTPPQ